LQLFLYFLGGLIGLYLLLSLIFTYLVQQLPRKPITDPPDWGRIIDTKIPAIDGGMLEVWRIEPQGPSRGLVVLAHGWSRNRDRMVSRARIFAKWGFTTVLHSARDHVVVKWLDRPVILYGHSIGSAAAIIAASRNPGRIQFLFLEASYAYTREALLSLYRWVNPFFGICFGPMILFWLNLFYGNKLDTVSPARLAVDIKIPVMLIHGEKDRRFPLAFAIKLKRSFAPDQVEFYMAEGAGHSHSSRTPGYEAAIKSFLDRHLR
jgi:pimeloyl-ACP methyl ester carboxylesterase